MLISYFFYFSFLNNDIILNNHKKKVKELIFFLVFAKAGMKCKAVGWVANITTTLVNAII